MISSSCFRAVMFHRMFFMFHRGAPLGVPPEGPPGPLLAVQGRHVSPHVFHVSPDVFHVSPGGMDGGAPGILRGPALSLGGLMFHFMFHVPCCLRASYVKAG